MTKPERFRETAEQIAALYEKKDARFKPIEIGERFGYLTVLEFFRKDGKWRCKCRCDCGTIKVIEKSSLQTGRTRSCGCYNKKRVHETHSKGNFSNTRLYNTWVNMKARCYNKHNPQYKNYGGRGIAVCEEWKNGFLSFRSWALQNGWNEDHGKFEITLDRKDVNGNYTPNNCRWASQKEQANNQRRSRRWEYNGKEFTLQEISEQFNINHMALRSRLYEQGLDAKTAIEKPLQKRRSKYEQSRTIQENS